MRFGLLATIVLSGAIGSIASAQTSTGVDGQKLINLDTPKVLAPGTGSVRLDFRAFGGDEGQTYGTVDLNYGFDKGLGILLRSSFSDTSTFLGQSFDIRHGGADWEALLKYSYPQISNLALFGGLSVANTPAHRDVFGVVEAAYQYQFRALVLYGNAKLVTGSDTTVFSLGAGASYDLGDGFQLIGDFTWPLSDDTTYSTTTGAAERDVLYGAALRYALPGFAPGQLTLDAGLTNALGGSSGFSVTPSLGSTVGLYLAATYRY